MQRKRQPFFFQKQLCDGQSGDLTSVVEDGMVATMRFHLTLVRMTIIKESTNSKYWRRCGKKGTPYTVGGNLSWCSHCGEQYGGFLKEKTKIELLYDPAIPLLGMYISGRMKTLIGKDTHTPRFKAQH